MSGGSGPLPRRRERTITATQACEACRKRKLRCDEQRPRCVNCRNFDGNCEYRETVPSKIDRSKFEILDKLNGIEAAIDRLVLSKPTRESRGVSTDMPGSSSEVSKAQDQISIKRASSQLFDKQEPSGRRRSGLSETNSQGSLTLPHRVLLWPVIRSFVMRANIRSDSNLSDVWQEGTAWFIKRELMNSSRALPAHFGLAKQPRALGHVIGLATFCDLTVVKALDYTDAYFNTFNMLSPILSRSLFMEEVINQVLQAGYVDSNWRTVIALFVFALGQLAVEGVLHHSLSLVNENPDDLRSDSSHHPPGLPIFNEARRRLGLITMHNSIEKVQALLLQATYFEACSRHTDYWHSVVTASMACLVLIKCRSDDWMSDRGDLIKRAYWTCVLHEELFHIDLDLPSTSVVAMEDTVPLPHFHEFKAQSQLAFDRSQQNSEIYTSYFLAMITLRRVIGRTHEALQDIQHSPDCDKGPLTIIREMSQQLEAWRETLPPLLQWSDHDIAQTSDNIHQTDPQDTGLDDRDLLNADNVALDSSLGLKLVQTTVRARFYYTRIVVNLPLVYKVLHNEQPLSVGDVHCFISAIESACDLSLVMNLIQNRQRLMPQQFAWIQSFTSTLLILRIISTNEQLRFACEQRIGISRMESAAKLMLTWIRDVQDIDDIAQWSWRILEPIYLSMHGE